jgi:5'-nucleotidase
LTLRSELIDPALLAQLAPSTDRELLRQTQNDPNPPLEQRVFVNRTLRMEKIRYVGFDLDWTLADYDRDQMSRLAFKLTLERLVERFGYPPEILAAEFRADFCRRGLILDTEAGTVLKMNRHRYVGRAYHGRRFLEAPERGDLYRRDPINPASSRFYHADTLFELPEVNIFSEVIDLAIRQPDAVQVPSFVKLFQETRQAIDSIHADGTLKQHILANLESFLPQDPLLPLALERMALDGKKLMLITNSEFFYTDGLCHRLFDGMLPGVESWREIFDLIIVSAGKPTFFRKSRPFIQLDAQGNPVGEVETPEWGGIYAGGSRDGLMRLLGVLGEQVLYVGDHIYGDILSTKLSSTWRTALVVSELEDELRTRREMTAQLKHVGVLRAELGDLGLQMDNLLDIIRLYRRLGGPDDQQAAERFPTFPKVQEALTQLRGEHKSMRQHAERLQNRISKAINLYWGSTFKQGSNKSLFGAQVDDFACVYTSRVRNFAHYGSQHYFRVTSDPMMHEVDLL